MNIKHLVVASLLVLPCALQAAGNEFVGLWKSVDDTSGEPKALVNISEENGFLVGDIAQLYRTASEDPDPVCTECVGDLKGNPIQGLRIIQGLKRSGDEYSGGTILDPATGKSYKCKVSLEENGSVMKVRGYVGAPMFGRTQIWVRQ